MVWDVNIMMAFKYGNGDILKQVSGWKWGVYAGTKWKVEYSEGVVTWKKAE